MTVSDQPLRIIPLGGLGEIGMNCMILEYADEIIIVDCGLMFSDLVNFGIEFVIPDFSYLLERKEKVKAYIMTHGHEDHIGALTFALKAGIQAPIYASNFTSLMIREKLKEHGLTSSTELRPFRMGEKFGFKNFKIQTVSVNHSIIDAAALIIDTPQGKVIHTGDFRIDPTPFWGQTIDHETFKKAGDEGVLLLMSDSTNVERHEHSVSEQMVYQSFEEIFAKAEGLIVLSMFSSNVARMAQVLEIAGKQGKKVALSGRSMEQNVRLGAELGVLHDKLGPIIGIDDIENFPRDQVIVLSTGSQGEPRSAMVRIGMGEHKQIQLQKKDLVLFSSRLIPGNEKAVGRLINQLFKLGADVLYEAVHDIHVSGHATRPELKQMLEWTRPKFFMPIHGEYRHLVHHTAVAKEVGLPEENILIATNGDILDVSGSEFKKVDRLEEARILVESREGTDVSKSLLKDRRQLAEKGVVFVMVVRNSETLQVIAGPDIVTRGLADDKIEGWLVEEAKILAKNICESYEKGVAEGTYSEDLRETLRVEVRRFFNTNIAKKPVVIPLVIDL